MPLLQNIPIVHATTVHPWWDNRVNNKMVNHLARSGRRVYFIVNHYPETERPLFSNLRIITLECKTGKTDIGERIRKNLRTYQAVTRLPDKGIFHFHDPEMIFIAALLRLQGWQVVYDIHEDLYHDLAQKPYLGWFARKLLPQLFRMIEKSIIVPFGFKLVIAEKTYRKRYPKGATILNYPDQAPYTTHNKRSDFQRINLLYTGVIQKNRGTYLFNHILQADPDIHITLIGRCDKALREDIEQSCKNHRSRLHMTTHPNGIPYREIVKAYEQGEWAAGMVIFPDTPLYREKEPTKFFEYIQFSLPILASSFPLWHDFIHSQNIGLCIHPDRIDVELPSLLDILRDRNRWETMRNNCKQAAPHYTWESQYQKLIKLYEGITHHSVQRLTEKC